MATTRTRRWWKERSLADSYARIKSPAMLRAHIEHKGYSLTRMAQLVSYQRMADGGQKVSRQMISMLTRDSEVNPKTGKPFWHLATCSLDLAVAIETVLEVPDHFYFDVLSKSRDKRQTVNGEAA